MRVLSWKCQRILVGKSEGEKKLFEKSMCRWNDKIKADVKKSVGTLWAGFIWLRIGTSGGRL